MRGTQVHGTHVPGAEIDHKRYRVSGACNAQAVCPLIGNTPTWRISRWQGWFPIRVLGHSTGDTPFQNTLLCDAQTRSAHGMRSVFDVAELCLAVGVADDDQ